LLIVVFFLPYDIKHLQLLLYFITSFIQSQVNFVDFCFNFLLLSLDFANQPVIFLTLFSIAVDDLLSLDELVVLLHKPLSLPMQLSNIFKNFKVLRFLSAFFMELFKQSLDFTHHFIGILISLC